MNRDFTVGGAFTCPVHHYEMFPAGAVCQRCADFKAGIEAAAEKYEALLKMAFPDGAGGEVYEMWNAIREEANKCVNNVKKVV